MTRTAEGGWTAWIATSDSFSLEKLPDQLRPILEAPDFSDAVVSRLFPRAYTTDPDAEEEYQRLLRQDLVRQKLNALQAFERTVESAKKIDTQIGTVLVIKLSDEDLALWLGFLHDMRTVLGTCLDISDDDWHQSFSPEDPNAMEWVTLEWLSYLEENILDALRQSEGLGSARFDPDDLEQELDEEDFEDDDFDDDLPGISEDGES
jgi:hypothetical protein